MSRLACFMLLTQHHLLCIVFIPTSVYSWTASRTRFTDPFLALVTILWWGQLNVGVEVWSARIELWRPSYHTARLQYLPLVACCIYHLVDWSQQNHSQLLTSDCQFFFGRIFCTLGKYVMTVLDMHPLLLLLGVDVLCCDCKVSVLHFIWETQITSHMSLIVQLACFLVCGFHFAWCDDVTWLSQMHVTLNYDKLWCFTATIDAFCIHNHAPVVAVDLLA